MKKRSAKDRGGDLRGEAKKAFLANALQIPFEGIARLGRGRDRIVIKAGPGKGRGSASFGVNIKF